MAATKNAYFQETKATVKINGVDINIWPALFLQSTVPTVSDLERSNGYFNAADIPPIASDWVEALRKIKLIFKLDMIFQWQGNVDGTIKSGFIGACIDNSPNAVYHKSTRFSGKYIKYNGNSYNLFNDSGLNTMGDIIPGTWPNVYSNLVAGGIKITSTVIAAFYVFDHKWGIRMKCIGIQDHPENAANYTESNFTNVFEIPMQKNTISVLNQYPVNVGNYYLIAPNRYEVKQYITNDEGTIEKDLWTVTMALYSRKCGYSNSSLEEAIRASIGTDSNYYFNTNTLVWKDMVTGNPLDDTVSLSIVSQDSGGNIPAPSGYYVFQEIYNNRRGYVQVSGESGQIVGWSEPSADTPTEGFDLTTLRSAITYFGFRASNVESSINLEFAYNQAVQNEWTVIGTIYSSYDGIYHYVAESGGQFASNGYYVVGYGYDLATTGWMRLYNGQVVESSMN